MFVTITNTLLHCAFPGSDDARMGREILRCAQNDNPRTRHSERSEVSLVICSFGNTPPVPPVYDPIG